MMTGIQIDVTEVMALTAEAVENLQISMESKAAAVIAAGTTTAINDGGTFADVVKVVKRNFQIRTDLNMTITEQIQILEAAAKAVV
jgi:aspartokinase-like uncharacterized kinase